LYDYVKVVITELCCGTKRIFTLNASVTHLHFPSYLFSLGMHIYNSITHSIL